MSGREPDHTEQVTRLPWGARTLPDPHVWRTLGYRNVVWEPGLSVIEWDAPEDYCFRFNDGYVVHGGMVATLLDTAMGGACWSTLEEGEQFLTGELRVEFYRSARPGLLRAEGRVEHRTRRVVFCGADLYDGEGTAIAAARCTQIMLTRS